MPETRRIVNLSTRVTTGYPWHAANLKDLLADITVAEAIATPLPGSHSIWELVLHMTGWADEVTHRVKGRRAGTPRTGNWPAVGRPTLKRWQAATTGVLDAYAALDATVKALAARELDTPVVDFRTRKDGKGLSRYVTIHGVIHHAVYHAGQIAMLKAALRRAGR